jgi:hypothetical protein
MNYFSAWTCARWLGAAVLALLVACSAAESESADRGASLEYGIHYRITPIPSAAAVRISLRLRQGRALVREMSFEADADFSDFEGDGALGQRGRRVTWQPPASGGELSWRVAVMRERGDGGSYDALLTRDWGILRMEDIIPRARTRTLKGAFSRTTLEFDLPRDWSAISEYSARELPMLVDRPDRRFDQPTGWIAMGGLGVRRETIAGTRVAIAAPEGQDVRRMEMLALLNWTLPELNEILPNALPRLTIVSAGAPMWRGGLSAPASFFLHAERPLISENATSPLLHEVMHTALRLRARQGYDWIVEGFAEYFSIELLRRGRAITHRRARTALEKQAEWAKRADNLCVEASSAETTALAVTLFAELDSELRNKSDGAASLDDLLPLIIGGEVDLETLTSAAADLIGETPDTLHIDRLPGCRTIQ